mmetsp:Transcript_11198/g.22035  ORF Transcript_11198/g.22035 Transcript_11198/m.22035 type:complete len:227 (+) Transcript_11198:20-700(+)
MGTCCSEVRMAQHTDTILGIKKPPKSSQVQSFSANRLKSYIKSLSYNSHRLKSLIYHPCNSEYLISVLEKPDSKITYGLLEIAVVEKTPEKVAETANEQLNHLCQVMNLEFVGVVLTENGLNFIFIEGEFVKLTEYKAKILRGPISLPSLSEKVNESKDYAVVSMLNVGKDFVLIYKKTSKPKQSLVEQHEMPASVQGLCDLINSNTSNEFVTLLATDLVYLVYAM